MKNLSKWLPVFLWAGVIFVLSSISQVKASEFLTWDFIAKKIAHLSEYSILFTLLFRATNNNYTGSFLLTMLYAVSDEVHQGFVPGRNAAIYDLGFDFAGAGIASYLIWKYKQLLKNKRAK